VMLGEGRIGGETARRHSLGVISLYWGKVTQKRGRWSIQKRVFGSLVGQSPDLVGPNFREMRTILFKSDRVCGRRPIQEFKKRRTQAGREKCLDKTFDMRIEVGNRKRGRAKREKRPRGTYSLGGAIVKGDILHAITLISLRIAFDKGPLCGRIISAGWFYGH